MEDTALDTLIREADPYAGRPPLPDAAAREWSVPLVAEVVATTRGPVRLLGTRRRRLAAVSVAVLMAVPLGAVAKDRMLAHTGTYNAPGGESGPGTSEMMEICADDFPAYVRSLPIPPLPLPPGVTRAELPGKLLAVLRREAMDCAANEGLVVSADRVTAKFHEVAHLEWLCEARKRQAASDRPGLLAASAQAADQVQALVDEGDYAGDWSQYIDLLRRGDLRIDVVNNGRFDDAIGCTA